MRRCLQLAAAGKGRVAPNPMVGCVITRGGRIIGEGYHRMYGREHAEVNALNSVGDKSLIKGSTVYVSLEPCAHYGHTPPCALRLAQEKVGRVVICNDDPNPLVAGKGIEILREAGIEVETGVLADEGRMLNRRFFTYFEKHRPYIILKWAQSSDGFIDGEGERPIVISNPVTKALVHKLRAEESAILVGARTAIKDNPKLRTRRWSGPDPVRIAIDRTLRIPASHHLYDGSAPTIIYNEIEDSEPRVRLDFSRPVLPQICDDLYARKLQSLIVEGGRETLQAFIDQALWDEAHIEISPIKIAAGTPAPDLQIPQFGGRQECRGSLLYCFLRN